jgi:hypothetical protein
LIRVRRKRDKSIKRQSIRKSNLPRAFPSLFSPSSGDTIQRGMHKGSATVLNVLTKLEVFYGKQEPSWPTDPYLFIVWWLCGYPASDAACAKGWRALNQEVGIEPKQILAACPAALATALRPGGMVPELRAMRLKEVAARVKDEFGGDLRSVLVGPIAQVRKVLKSFPNIATRELIAYCCLPGLLLWRQCHQIARMC